MSISESQRPRKRFSGGKPLITESLVSIYSEETHPENRTITKDNAPVFAAERSVAGALLANNANYDLFAGLIRKTDFLDPNIGVIYDTACQIISGHIPNIKIADAVTVSSCIKGISGEITIERLQTLIDDAPSDEQTLLEHANIIKTASSNRRLERSLQEATQIARENIAVDEKINRIIHLISAVETETSYEVTSIGDLAHIATQRIMDMSIYKDRTAGIETGFHELDLSTSGFHGGQIIVAAGRPGMGKTAFAFSIAAHVSRKHHVLMLSMEMSGEELAKRMIAMKTGIDARRLSSGCLEEHEWEKLAIVHEELRNSKLNLVVDTSMNISRLCSICRKLKRQGKLDMLIIDYIQLMEPDISLLKEKRERQIADISRTLKKLAIDLDIPILVLSQLNRELERRQDKRPIPSDLRESGALEQDADMIIMLYRDIVYNPLTCNPDLAEILLRKHRNGPTGEFYVTFDSKTTAFIDNYFASQDAYLSDNVLNPEPNQEPTIRKKKTYHT